ncbi:MAG: hypothetical protein AB1733_22460 [Thermodesulfobacteriota bacterium]
MYEIAPIDILFAVLLAMSVPAAVIWYLSSARVSKLFRDLVILGGLLWICLAFFNEDYVYMMLGITRADAAVHWRAALEAAQQLEEGKWPFRRALPLGNETYVAYLTFLHVILGATNYGAIAINGFLAFLGGLTLTRSLAQVFPLGRGREKWFFLLIFCPSTVFWTTANMKEGLMYWAICQILAPLIEASSTRRAPISLMGVIGLGVAGLFRPHIAMIWVFAAGISMLMFRKRIAWAVLLLLLMPMVFLALRAFVGSSLMSPTEALEVMERQYQGLNSPGAGSFIDHGTEGPIFFVSGFVATFFRPFPWEIKSLRTLIASAETWGLTFILILAWLQLGSNERRQLLRFPAIWSSIMICLFFSIIFTYLPIEGIIVRQRVQLIPGILVAALTPILFREHVREQKKLLELLPKVVPQVSPGLRSAFRNKAGKDLNIRRPELPQSFS